MQATEKREQIIAELKHKMSENGMEITISSPKFSYFYLSKKKIPIDPDPANAGQDIPVSLNAAPAEAPQTSMSEFESMASVENTGTDGDEEEIDFENLSPKEFKRMKKEKAKEEKKFLQIRKDAHKRGYDTSVLRQFDDPEELYAMSDKEIDQMTAVGYVNEDGFYDFVYPPDAEGLRREGLSTKKILLIALLIVIGGAVIVWSLMNATSMF